MSLETEKMNLRSTIKALSFKKDRVACRIAESVGITGQFFSDELPLDDHRVAPSDKLEFEDLSTRLYNAVWKLDALENDSERHHARQNCYDFVSLLSLDECKTFLELVGCKSTVDLTEKLISNPNLIEEVVLNEL